MITRTRTVAPVQVRPLSPLVASDEVPARVRAFGGRLAPRSTGTPAVDVDPRSATALQIALVLADIRSWPGCLWVTADGVETDDAYLLTDRDLIEDHRASLWGADDVTDYDEGGLIYSAWVAMVTPAA